MILQGDARALPLPDESVDLVVTSPPYFALRSYQDDGEHYEGQVGSESGPQAFLESLWAATREMVRVLKPEGSIFVNLGDKYAGTGGGNDQSGLSPKSTLQGNGHIGGGPKLRATPRVDKRTMPRNNTKETTGFVRPKSLMGLPWRYAIGCMDQLDLILRAEIVWAKPNGLPESVKDRVRRNHEQWFHFTKQGVYFSSVDNVREPYPATTLARYRNGGAANTVSGKVPGAVSQRDKEGIPASWSGNPLGRLPNSVWTIATEPLNVPQWARDKYDLPEHFAAFPTEWPRRIILGWSPEGGTVLDPFGGTGTTALVAGALGRVGISVDLSHDYCELARWRINESGHGTKALSRTWAERQEGLAV